MIKIRSFNVLILIYNAALKKLFENYYQDSCYEKWQIVIFLVEYTNTVH